MRVLVAEELATLVEEFCDDNFRMSPHNKQIVIWAAVNNVVEQVMFDL